MRQTTAAGVTTVGHGGGGLRCRRLPPQLQHCTCRLRVLASSSSVHLKMSNWLPVWKGSASMATKCRLADTSRMPRGSSASYLYTVPAPPPMHPRTHTPDVDTQYAPPRTWQNAGEKILHLPRACGFEHLERTEGVDESLLRLYVHDIALVEVQKNGKGLLFWRFKL